MHGSHVFISYSRRDGDFIKHLIVDLQTAGISVWIDSQGLKVGTSDWEQSIRDAIRNAYAVLLVASPNSRESRYVRDELQIAEMYQRTVVAIWALGDYWPDSIRMGLMGMQYADARGVNYSKALLEIISVLNHLATALPSVSTISSYSSEPDFKPRNPYKGLRAFTSKDKNDFFGRDKFIAELVNALGENIDTNRFLVVHQS